MNIHKQKVFKNETQNLEIFDFAFSAKNVGTARFKRIELDAEAISKHNKLIKRTTL